MNRYGKGLSLLLVWGSVGCRFDFELEPPDDEGANAPTDMQRRCDVAVPFICESL